MAATGKTPILLYGSTTPTNAPTAGNLTNSSNGCEIAINVADKNLFFKDSTDVVNTVPIRQSSASSNGWLSSTDWSTFNGKASTSSPTFSGNVTLSTGDLVIGTSGKGIAYPVTSGGSALAPAFSAYSNAAQSVNNNTYTKVEYKAEEFDTNNNFDSTTNYRFTPTVAGYYQISWSVNIGVTTAFIDTILYKNGGQFKRGQFSGSANAGGSAGSCLVYFNGSTDYVEVYFSQQSGGTQTIGNSSVTTYFQGSMVRGA